MTEPRLSLNAAKLKEFKQRLHEEKSSLLKTISRIEETGIGDTMANSTGELSMYDNHPADLGDELFERSKDVALRDNEHVLLEQVETALQKIEEGTYGICEACGQAIDIKRLEALPLATRCLRCQREQDQADETQRPLEEEVLYPPFQRNFLDNAESEWVGFDGEDALQAVLRYGSSDTPQDIPGSRDYDNLWPNSDEHPGIVEASDAILDDRTATARNAENGIKPPKQSF